MSSGVRTSVRPGFAFTRAPIAQTEALREFPRRAAPIRTHIDPESSSKQTRVFVAAENRLLQDAILRALAKNTNLLVLSLQPGQSFSPEIVAKSEAKILLLNPRGELFSDLAAVRAIRTAAASTQILMIGMSGDEAEFMQYVKAGVRGYLRSDASSTDVLEAIRRVQEGEAICPGAFCALLFRYFELESADFPSATVHQKLGFTRREQQIVPFIAEGLTNKEIGAKLNLSEQTVKNHLYRMKQKVGADGRLGIVQICRSQGFLV